MATKLVYELDSAQYLAELPYYNRIDHPSPPTRLRTRSPNENRKQNERNKHYNPKRSRASQTGLSLPLITPDQHELPPYFGWSGRNPTPLLPTPTPPASSQEKKKKGSNTLHRWNCNQRGYEYRKPRQMIDRESQTLIEKGSQTMEAKAHCCPKCQSCPKAPKRQQEDNIPPPWFTNWMEANMTSQEDDDTAPPWFTDHMDDHKHNYLDPLTRRVKENQKQIRILLIESSAIIKGMDRINKTLKAERTHPIHRPITSNETEPLLDTDKELAILANEID